jgi:glycosyltransferase involved in cell wall biosynthesis
LLEVAGRAVRAFELDILDGGVTAPIGVDGIFFEEAAVYPAAHQLSGFIFALIGLYDYVALTSNARIEKLISRSLAGMHSIIVEFDASFWTYSDLLNRHLASPDELALQTALLEVLAAHSGCDHCAELASRWKRYQCSFGSCLRYLISSRRASFTRKLEDRFRGKYFPKSQASPLTSVCIPLPGFPITGGVLTVLEGVTEVTKDLWQIEYLAQQIGANTKGYVIHRFGTTRTDSWFFPAVWLYALAGFHKLVSLMHHGAGYQVLLPQDGVFTGAFTGLAAKLAGVRVVCIDHSNLTSLKSSAHRAERIKFLATKTWPRRILHRLLTVWYWPSLWLLARISARFIDHYLVPGVAGDGVEEVLTELGVHQSRVTRFASMMDVSHHTVLDDTSKASMRKKKGIAADAIVVAIICRLSPEKGLEVALKSISQALSTLSPDLCARVRVIIAGDGPLRKSLEEDIRTQQLSQTCWLWGEISAEEVLSLLAMSDIFLYTSTRGACFPMAVLEAMASGCAVIASKQPESNALLLGGGRGIAVPPNSVAQTSEALVRLVNGLELCRQMGQAARNYIATVHGPVQFRRNLQRASYWSALNEMLDLEKQSETGERERGN